MADPVLHQDHFRIDLPDAPYLVVFWGDWHIGEAGTNHQLLKRDAEILHGLRCQFGERLVLIGMGDYIGGYMKSKTPSNTSQVLKPGEQRKAARQILALTVPDLIIQGDHDEWHARQDDENEWLHEFTQAEGLRFAQWGAALELESTTTLRLLTRHRFSGSRGANPYLPQINLHSKWGPADVVALAHVHSNPGVSLQRSRREHEGSFHAVQSGTYKVYDDYARKLGVGHGEYGVPSLLVYPDSKEILPYNDLSEGARALRSSEVYV